MGWYVKKSNGTCQRCFTLASLEDTGPPGISGDEEITISASVGAYGANYSSDVVTIQKALNQVPPDNGGASPKLVIDGKCGPKTKQAIQVFQIKHFGWKGADGLIERGKQTLAQLNEVLGKKIGSGDPQYLVTASVINFALSMVTAAQTNMSTALLYLDSKASNRSLPSFSREFKMRLLNKHFSLDSSNDRMNTYNKIKLKYDRMKQVFQRPGGPWGFAVFERDPYKEDYMAYVYGGGYFKPGQIWYHRGKKNRLDSIYLCTRFYDMADQHYQSFILVHELAHFVGQFDEISDYAYNHEGSPRGTKVKNLSHELKALNAECYANFAYEARTGQEPWHRFSPHFT